MENYNLNLVIMSYIVAVIGSFMALVAVRDALFKNEGERKGLMFLAALCLGGMGIWSMHFVGMLALDMHGMAMNFNWWLTILSLIVGIAVVYAGLLIMGLGKFSIAKLVASGILVGSGVVAMHYTGMWAMNVQADVHWDMAIVALSAAIAVAASIVALWLAINVQKLWQKILSALVMGVAVCGMHYTGMTAASFVFNEALPYVAPMSTTSTVLALIIAIVDSILVVVATMVFMVNSNTRKLAHQ